MTKKQLREIRQFVKVDDGRIGVVIANDTAGGVFRGHCDMWFGEMSPDDPSIPLIEQLTVTDNWEVVDCPIGLLPSDMSDKEKDAAWITK